MAVKTTIQVSFDISGVTVADGFAKENDPALRRKATALRDALTAVSRVPATEWPDPFPFEGRPEEYESFLRNGLSHAVSVSVLRQIESILDGQLSFSVEPYFNSIVESLVKTDRTEVSQRQYSIQFTDPSICYPCGRHCHLCEAIVNSAVAGSAFAPLIWVAISGGKPFNFYIRMQYKFILENT